MMQCLLQDANLDSLRKQGGFASSSAVEAMRRRAERLVRDLEERLEERTVKPLEENIVRLSGALELLQLATSPDQLSELAFTEAAKRVQTVRRRRRPG